MTLSQETCPEHAKPCLESKAGLGWGMMEKSAPLLLARFSVYQQHFSLQVLPEAAQAWMTVKSTLF